MEKFQTFPALAGFQNLRSTTKLPTKKTKYKISKF
jgi:hypothetical protein